MNDYVESWEFYNKKDKSIARLIKDDYIQIDTDQKDTLYNTYKDDINKGWRKLVLDTDTYTYNAEEVIHSFLYDTNNSNIIKDMRQNERIPNLSGNKQTYNDGKFKIYHNDNFKVFAVVEIDR